MDRLSDADIERIVKAVVERLREQQQPWVWPSPDSRWHYPTKSPAKGRQPEYLADESRG